ncbi:MAG TPA: Ldh family oxidoreductase [Chloroflexota bacterium]|nr:Ldh family oxidoreductase [Chloroflexota bacterium]
MAEMTFVPPDTLEDLTTRIFVAAGTPEDLAKHVAQHLVKANLSGHDSHGVIRIPAYIAQSKTERLAPSARPEVVKEGPSSAVVDGKRGFGQVAASFAMDVAIRKATETGVAGVSIRRANHIGRLGHYSEEAAERGFIAFVSFGSAAPGSGHMAPFGGAQRHFGTNPISFGIPSKETPPVIVDFATTMVAEGKIQVARAKHAELPPGCIVDKEGKPSTNPHDFYNGGMILPAGGHKGYGLSMVAALLGAGLTAEAAATEGRGGGVFVLAINPRAFTTEEAFFGTVDNVAGAVKKVPTAPGFSEVLLPGEPEAKARAERRKDGVPVPADTWEAIGGAAKELGVELPQI